MPELSVERVVNVRRVKANGQFVLNPMGTFRDYGGYVGINPYRELPTVVSPKQLGMVVVDLLARSGPTGHTISDFESCRAESATEETERIRDQYFFGKQSIESQAKRFQHLEVSSKDNRRSWDIVKFKFDKKSRAMVPDVEKRAKFEDGPSSLGKVILELLSS
jgi:hypothetical protein